ncbi:MAG: outer membrane beta-barrel protein [Deltaproteobacteria bacterium]|nr:outer membrane beta-barrel protein [Deltaproteobacteria bacterium]
MGFTRKSLGLLIVVTFIFFLPVASLAAAKITIKPKISSNWRVDTNFFEAEDIEREVYTYLLQPGIDLGFKTAKSKILIDYTLNIYRYDDRDLVPSGQKPASDDDYYGHTLIFQTRHKLSDRILIGLDDSYYRTRDSAQTDRFDNSVSREKYFVNRLTPMLYYDFGEKFTVGLRYRNTIFDYKRNEGGYADSTEDRGMFDLIYNLSRTTSFDLEYQHWQKDYDATTSDYTSDQINLIVKKEFKVVSFGVGGGYHERDFDNPALDNISVWNYIVTALAEKKGPEEDSPPRSYIKLSSERNFNDQGLGDDYYTATTFTVDAGHVFMEKIKVDITAYYQKSEYEKTYGLTPEGTTELRDDDTYHISADIGYMFTDWLTFTITGGYEDRDSNLEGKDYLNKYFIAKLDFSYDLGKK